jgi:hypothetical protein
MARKYFLLPLLLGASVAVNAQGFYFGKTLNEIKDSLHQHYPGWQMDSYQLDSSNEFVNVHYRNIRANNPEKYIGVQYFFDLHSRLCTAVVRDYFKADERAVIDWLNERCYRVQDYTWLDKTDIQVNYILEECANFMTLRIFLKPR